jgi:hypothetical protein
MYHDVGMYRDKPFEHSLNDLVGILDRRQILGHTMKGAQVSANAGPTNWMGSNLTARIRRNPETEVGLHVDDNAPRYARWYCTMGRRVAIPIDPSEVEVIVNGDSLAAVHMRQAETLRVLHQAGQPVVVRGIDDFLQTRFGEVASHLPESERADFQEGLQASPLWAQKAVGDMAARHGDKALAEFYQRGMIENVLKARDQVRDLLDSARPGQGVRLTQGFFSDVAALSPAEQMLLAERFAQPRTYTVEAAADGYIGGQGLAIAAQVTHQAALEGR